MNTALMRRNREAAELFDDCIISDHILREYRGHETQVSVPRGVSGIGERAFAHCDTVTGVELPDSVRFIRMKRDEIVPVVLSYLCTDLYPFNAFLIWIL